MSPLLDPRTFPTIGDAKVAERLSLLERRTLAIERGGIGGGGGGGGGGVGTLGGDVTGPSSGNAVIGSQTSTPQFGRMGLGVASDSVIPLATADGGIKIGSGAYIANLSGVGTLRLMGSAAGQDNHIQFHDGPYVANVSEAWRLVRSGVGNTLSVVLKTPSQPGTSKQYITFQPNGQTSMSQRVNMWNVGPFCDPTGGPAGDGSNVVLDVGGPLPADYPNARAGPSRILCSAWTPGATNSGGGLHAERDAGLGLGPDGAQGANTLRIARSGGPGVRTVDLSGITVTGHAGAGTTFLNIAVGDKVTFLIPDYRWLGTGVPVFSSGSKVEVLARVATLTGTAPNYTGFTVNKIRTGGQTGTPYLTALPTWGAATTGVEWAINPDRTDIDRPAGGFGQSYADFYAGLTGTHTFNGHGSFNYFDQYDQITDDTSQYGGGYGVDGYGELGGYCWHAIGARAGALITGEWAINVLAGKMARAAVATFILEPENDYTAYNNPGIFGANSSWIKTGERCLWLQTNSPTKKAGTALQIYDIGGSGGGWTRAIAVTTGMSLGTSDTDGNLTNPGVNDDLFVVDGKGNVGLGLQIDQTTNTAGLPAKLCFEMGTGIDADGIRFEDTTANRATRLFRYNTRGNNDRGIKLTSLGGSGSQALLLAFDYARDSGIEWHDGSANPQWRIRRQASGPLQVRDVRDFPVVSVNSGTNTITTTGINGYQVGDTVFFGSSVTGAGITGIALGTGYFVVATPSTTDFRVSLTAGGAVVAVSALVAPVWVSKPVTMMTFNAAGNVSSTHPQGAGLSGALEFAQITPWDAEADLVNQTRSRVSVSHVAGYNRGYGKRGLDGVAGQSDDMIANDNINGAGGVAFSSRNGFSFLGGYQSSSATLTANITFPLTGTTLPVSDLSVFSADGGVCVIGTDTYYYAGRSAATGAGTLTGVSGGSVAHSTGAAVSVPYAPSSPFNDRGSLVAISSTMTLDEVAVSAPVTAALIPVAGTVRLTIASIPAARADGSGSWLNPTGTDTVGLRVGDSIIVNGTGVAAINGKVYTVTAVSGTGPILVDIAQAGAAITGSTPPGTIRKLIYHEGAPLVAAVNCYSFGSYAPAAEFDAAIKVPSRAHGLSININATVQYSAWNDPAIFGANSPWQDTGSRGVQIQNTSAGNTAGTGLFVNSAGNSLWKRAIVFNKGAGSNGRGLDHFCIDGTTGYIGSGADVTTNQTKTIPARLTLGAAADFGQAEGIQFGTTTPVRLFRSAAQELQIGTPVGSGSLNHLQLNWTGAIASSVTNAVTGQLAMAARGDGPFDIGRQSAAGSILRLFRMNTVGPQPANPVLGITTTGGIFWGDGALPTDVSLIRQDANTLRCNNTIQADRGFFFPANAAHSTITPIASTANMYLKGALLVIRYQDAATVRYKYLNLAGTGFAWAYSGSQP